MHSLLATFARWGKGHQEGGTRGTLLPCQLSSSICLAGNELRPAGRKAETRRMKTASSSCGCHVQATSADARRNCLSESSLPFTRVKEGDGVTSGRKMNAFSDQNGSTIIFA